LEFNLQSGAESLLRIYFKINFLGQQDWSVCSIISNCAPVVHLKKGGHLVGGGLQNPHKMRSENLNSIAYLRANLASNVAHIF